MPELANEWRRSARKFGVAVLVFVAVIAIVQGVIAVAYSLIDWVLIVDTVLIFGIGVLAYVWSRKKPAS